MKNPFTNGSPYPPSPWQRAAIHQPRKPPLSFHLHRRPRRSRRRMSKRNGRRNSAGALRIKIRTYVSVDRTGDATRTRRELFDVPGYEISRYPEEHGVRSRLSTISPLLLAPSFFPPTLFPPFLPGCVACHNTG